MTATLDRNDRREALSERLNRLNDERRTVLAEIVPDGVGDDADRATNVDGHVRLAMIDRRIADVEAELADADYGHQPSADGTVTVGDIVTVDFGDGPEQYLLGSVEEAGPGLDVITPGRAGCRALVGATIGSSVTYKPRPRLELTATLVSVS